MVRSTLEFDTEEMKSLGVRRIETVWYGGEDRTVRSMLKLQPEKTEFLEDEEMETVPWILWYGAGTVQYGLQRMKLQKDGSFCWKTGKENVWYGLHWLRWNREEEVSGQHSGGDRTI